MKKRKNIIGIVCILISFTVGLIIGEIDIKPSDNQETESTSEITEVETIETEESRIIEETETESDTEVSTEPVIEYVSLGEFRITAYCDCKKCCGKWAENRPLDKNGNPIVIGASGKVLIPDYSIAVDPSVIPYGTKVYIDGHEYIAHDTGGTIDGNRIDLYMGSHEDALEWGVRYREIFVKVGE